MEADGAGILRLRGRTPLAGREHRGLMVLLDPAIAGGTYIMSGLRPALVPPQALEPEPLHLPAVRARHEIPALVRGLVLALDAREPLDRRCRAEQDLRPPREGPRAGFGKRDRIAFLVGRGRIGIHLVEEEVPRRHRAQADRAVGAGDDQDAGRELLRQHRIAGVARARRLHPLPQRRTFADQRIDALAREPLGKLDGRLHRQHRSWRVVDDVANPVVAGFREPDLRRLHHHDAARRVGRRQRIRDRPDVGRAVGAIAARLGRGARAEQSVPVRPFRDRQRRVGPEPIPPGLAKLLGAIERDQLSETRVELRRARRGGRGHAPLRSSEPRGRPRRGRPRSARQHVPAS